MSVVDIARRKKTMEELHRAGVEQFRAQPKLPLTVVLDDVRSMHNVGSVLRTADAFRVEEVVLCGITPLPPKPEIHKTALGAEDAVQWEHCASALEAVRRLADEGYVVCAVEQAHGSVPLNRFCVPEAARGRYAVVLGHEVRGVDQEVVSKAHYCLEIPQYGTKHSLNVSVTAGIIIHYLASLLR